MSEGPIEIDLKFRDKNPKGEKAQFSRVAGLVTQGKTRAAAEKLEELAATNPDMDPDSIIAAFNGNVRPDSPELDALRQSQGLPVPQRPASTPPPPEVDEEDWSDNPLGNLAKGITRTGFNVLLAPADMLRGGIEAYSGEIQGETENEGFTDGWDDWVSQIGLWQQVASWEKQGDGWFGLGGEAGENQEQARARNWGQTITTEDGTEMLVPKEIGTNLVETFGLNSQEGAGKILSAVSNLGFSLALDPVIATGAAKSLARGKDAKEVLETGAQLRNATASADKASDIGQVFDSADDLAVASKEANRARRKAVRQLRQQELDTELSADLEAVISQASSARTATPELIQSVRDLIGKNKSKRAALADEEIATRGDSLQYLYDELDDAQRIADEAGDTKKASLVAAQRESLDELRSTLQQNAPSRAAVERAQRIKDEITSPEAKIEGTVKRDAVRTMNAANLADRAHRSLNGVEASLKRMQVRKRLAEKAGDLEEVKAITRDSETLLAHAKLLSFTGTQKSIKEGIRDLNRAVKEISVRWDDGLDELVTANLDNARGAVDETEGAIKGIQDEIAQTTATADQALTDLDGAESGLDVLRSMIQTAKFSSDRLKDDAVRLLDEAKGAEAARTAKEARHRERLDLVEQVYSLSDEIEALKNGDRSLLRKAFDDSVAGANPGSIDWAKFQKALLGKWGKGTLQFITDETSFTKIWKASNRKIPVQVARQLADAKTQDEVLDVLARAAGARDGIRGPLNGFGMRSGSWMYRHVKPADDAGRAAKALGLTVKPVLRTYTSSQRIIPWAYRLKADDPETVVPGVSDWIDWTLSKTFRGPARGKYAQDIADFADAQVDRLAAAKDPLERRFLARESMKDTLQFIVDRQNVTESFKADFKAEISKAFENFREADEMVTRQSTKHYIDNSRGFTGSVLDGAENGPRGYVQLAQDIQLPDPKKIERLVREASKWDGIGKKSTELRRSFLESGVDRVFRTAVLVGRPAYILRNIGEMGFRMFLNGSLLGPLNMLGMAMRYSNSDSRIAKLFKRYDAYETDINGTAWRDKELDDALTNESWRMQGQIYRSHASVDYGVPGKSGMMRQSQMVGPEHKGFHRAWTKQLFVQRADPMMVDVARVRYGRVQGRLAQYMKEKGFEKPKDAVVEYYFSGPGKEYLDVLARERPETWGKWSKDRQLLQQYLFDDPKSIMKNEVEINLLGGKDPDLLDAWFSLSAGSRREFSKVTTSSLKKRNGYSQADTPFDFNARLEGAEAAMEDRWWLTKFVDGFFDKSAVLEGATNFGPETRKEYWKVITEQFGELSKVAQAEVLKVARESLKVHKFGTNKPKRDFQELERIYKSDQAGSMSRETLHDVAAGHAAKHTGEIFYDAQKRKQYWYALRLAFPFGAAWSNTMATWGKLAVQPQGAVRVLALTKAYEVATGGPRNYTDEEWEKIKNDPAHRPLIFKDPMSGQMSIQVPLVGDIIGSQNAIAPLNSFNLLTGGGTPLPGAGPVITMPWKSLNDTAVFDALTPDWVDKWIDPFPSGLPKGPIRATYETFMPAWSRRILAGSDPQFGDQEMLSLTSQVTTYVVSRNPERYMNEAGVIEGEKAELLSQDVATMTRQFSVFRGVVQAAFPGQIIYQWQLELGDDTQALQTAVNLDYQQFIKDNDGDMNAAQEQLEELYGPGALFLTIGKYKGGLNPSTRAGEFFTEHPEDLSNYEEIAGLLFPYDPQDYSAKFDRVLRAKGMREMKSVEEMTQYANNSRYFLIKSNLEEQVARGSMTKEQADATLDKYREELSVDYVPVAGGMDSGQKIELLQKALADKDSAIGTTQAGQAASRYMVMRDKALANITESGLGKTLGIQGASQIRAYLRQAGEQLVAENPEFERLWNTLLKHELEEPE